VLVVEDDLGIATQLVRGLRRDGYDADHVTTGGEALRWGEPDVVLLDLGLPDADGVEVCRHLRERSRVAIMVEAEGAGRAGGNSLPVLNHC
jgi:DNA-binding response OmpR family regulator